MDKETKYCCSAYENPEKRFQENGCVMSWHFGLDYDPFPGSLTPIDTKFGKQVVFSSIIVTLDYVACPQN